MRATVHFDEYDVRRWVTNLRRPDHLDDRLLAALLRAHGRDPGAEGLRAGRAAAAFLREKIDALRPAEGAPSTEALPHRVLTACFVRGEKSFQAAGRLGLSERQISRERSRAIALLTAELRGFPGGAPAAGPRLDLVARPDLLARLDAACAAAPRVHVTGGAGSGKTALVDAWAERSNRRVFWHEAAPPGEGPLAFLFELGDQLASADATLDSYVRDSLPRPDPALAARIALAALRREPHLLVLDGWDARPPAWLDAFLDAAARLPSARVVTAGRAPGGRALPSVAVPPLSRSEVEALLQLRGADRADARRVHAWTGGNARLADAAAKWLAGRPGAGPLRTAGGRASLVGTAAHLMWSARGRAA